MNTKKQQYEKLIGPDAGAGGIMDSAAHLPSSMVSGTDLLLDSGGAGDLLGQNRGGRSLIQSNDQQMGQPVHQILQTTSVQSTANKQLSAEPSPDKTGHDSLGVMNIKLRDNQMAAKPNIASERHGPPIPITTVSSQRGQRQLLEQEKTSHGAQQPENYKQGAGMKNVRVRSQHSSSGKSDADEAEGLVSGLDALSNAQISSRALNYQNVERSDVDASGSVKESKQGHPLSKKASFNRSDQPMSGKKMQFELFGRKTNQKGQFEDGKIEEADGEADINFPSRRDPARKNTVVGPIASGDSFASPDMKGTRKHGKTLIQVSENSSSVKKQYIMEQTQNEHKPDGRSDRDLENTEQKETKAKGERMGRIIEMQMEAQYRESINKIREGTFKNQLGAGNKSAQTHKKFFHQDRVVEVTVEKDAANRISKFHDEDDEIDLRVGSGSFHLKPQPMEGSGASQAVLQGSSRHTLSNLRPGADPDALRAVSHLPQRNANSFSVGQRGLPGRSFTGHNDQKRFGFDGQENENNNRPIVPGPTNMMESQNGGNGHQQAQNLENEGIRDVNAIHLNMQNSNPNIRDHNQVKTFQQAAKPPMGAPTVGKYGGTTAQGNDPMIVGPSKTYFQSSARIADGSAGDAVHQNDSSLGSINRQDAVDDAPTIGGRDRSNMSLGKSIGNQDRERSHIFENRSQQIKLSLQLSRQNSLQCKGDQSQTSSIRYAQDPGAPLSHKNSQRKAFEAHRNEIEDAVDFNDIELNRFECNVYSQPVGKFELPGEGHQQHPEAVQALDQAVRDKLGEGHDQTMPLSRGSKYSSSNGKSNVPPDAQENGHAQPRAAADNRVVGILQLSGKKSKNNKGGYLSIDDDEEDDFDEREAALDSDFRIKQQQNRHNETRITPPERSRIEGNLDMRFDDHPPLPHSLQTSKILDKRANFNDQETGDVPSLIDKEQFYRNPGSTGTQRRTLTLQAPAQDSADNQSNAQMMPQQRVTQIIRSPLKHATTTSQNPNFNDFARHAKDRSSDLAAYNQVPEEKKFKQQSFMSGLSGPSYPSEEISRSLQIDEQIATHEQYLEQLRQLKRDQEILSNQRFQQTYNDQGGDQSKTIRRPFIHQGPTPGQTMREANQTNSRGIGVSDNSGHAQVQLAAKSDHSQSSNRKEGNPQTVADVSASASKISITEIVSRKVGQGPRPVQQSATQPSAQASPTLKDFSQTSQKSAQAAVASHSQHNRLGEDIANLLDDADLDLAGLNQKQIPFVKGPFQAQQCRPFSPQDPDKVEQIPPNTADPQQSRLLSQPVQPMSRYLTPRLSKEVQEETKGGVSNRQGGADGSSVIVINTSRPLNRAAVTTHLSSPQLHQHLKKRSKIELIKEEKKEKAFKERLIRQFNLKMFDKVIYELKQNETQDGRIVEEEQSVMQDEQQASLSSGEQKIQDELMDAKRLGAFLYCAKGIDKQMIGTYFGEDKKFNQNVCKEFLSCFNFRKLPVDSCWRLIFSKSGLPKEGQQICRIMTVFQEVYLKQNSDNPVIQSWQTDTVWLLSVKLLDLNTNLHNPNVKPMLRYSKEAFVAQSMQFPELKHAFSEQRISDMYDRISTAPFENKVSLHERYFKRINELSYSLVQQGIDRKQANTNPETGSNPSRPGGAAPPQNQWYPGGSKKPTRNQPVSQAKWWQAVLKAKGQIFKEQGTIFTKYGRYGGPKQRIVFLNEDETEIVWRDRMNPKDKPRKMLIKEAQAVHIGSDHTAVMRKQKIPPVFDNYCISIIGKDRTLDLMIQDQRTIQMWCEKIRQLIESEKNKSKKQIEHSPESPSAHANPPEFELQIFQRDQCPECIEYIWKTEILNHLQKYWNPLKREINDDQEIVFDSSQLKQVIRELIQSQGGWFHHLTQEQKAKRSKSPQSFDKQDGQAHQVNLQPIGRSAAKEYGGQASRSTNKNASCGCGPGFGRFSKAKDNRREAPENEGSTMNKFLNFFNKKETLITLDQLWYRGLPNMARYCLWPILIGNQQQLNRAVYEALHSQVQQIRHQIGSAQLYQSHGRASLAWSSAGGDQLVNRLSVVSSNQGGRAQAPQSIVIQSRQLAARPSHLSSILSERDKEISAEESSIMEPQIPGSASLPYDHRYEGEDQVNESDKLRESNIFKLKKVDTHPTAHFSVETPGGEEYPDPASQTFEVSRSQAPNVDQHLQVDLFTEHMIMQFYKIRRKIKKICDHWEAASIIGELADIPVEKFAEIMNDVLCCFLLHKANLNGLQSAGSNTMDRQRHESSQWHLESASYISGLEKVLAPLVLIHLRELQNSEGGHLLNDQATQNVTWQVFVCFTNLTLSAPLTGGGSSFDSLYFLRHFITDDFAQIEWRMDFFDKLFARVLPQLHRQFQGINLKNEFFLHGWMMAMFVNVQGLEGLEFVLRIWDLYLLHGEPILYCVALAILKSKLHKLNNAPMQTWLDFFSRVKKVKTPQQSQFYHIGGSNIRSSHTEQEEQEGGSQFSSNNDPMTDPTTDPSSLMLIPLAQDIIKMYIDFDVQALFKEHQLQQIIAEQKNEIFTKMYLNDDV